jgi:outer membrane protein OmpA-like peptidoglycan-associated protein
MLALATLASCTVRTGTVVLLPEREARDSAVTVQEGDQRVTLDRPYAAADLTLLGPRAFASSADEVQATFGAALAAQPERPLRFTVYFVEGTESLTDESRATLETVSAELARRRVPDIVVIGHTDAVGTDAFNDVLARRRADAVRSALIARGIAAEHVVAAGRGKRELAVPTPDGVAEPRNRRVEILVR